MPTEYRPNPGGVIHVPTEYPPFKPIPAWPAPEIDGKIQVVWDMETGDPDDFLTLLLLCGHPKVNLRAVTITPGTADQVGLVRWALDRFDLDIPVGSFNYRCGKDGKQRVSQWHYRAYGDIPPADEPEEGWKVLERELGPDTVMITGGPLKNLGKRIQEMPLALFDPWPDFGVLMAQGGFAGEGVIPPERQLPKFAGKRTVPTYNLNGAPKHAQRVIDCPYFRSERFVGKHICHGVYYDPEMHERFEAVKDESLSLSLIYQGMEHYMARHPKGKKFHDPLAACCAIDPDIGKWTKVNLYREKGQWGSRLPQDVPEGHQYSEVEIITEFDHDRFVRVLTAH